MPSIGSITKTVRISAKDLEVIEELMKDGTSWSGAIHKLCTPHVIGESTPQKKEKEQKGTPQEAKDIPEYVERMEITGSFFGLKGEEIAGKLLDAMDEGLIMFDEGEFKAYEEYDLDKLKEVCRKKKIDVQKAIDRCIEMLENG